MEKELEQKNEEIANLKVSIDVENIYAEECEFMRKKMTKVEIDRAVLKTENGKLTRQIKEKSLLINQKKNKIGMLSKMIFIFIIYFTINCKKKSWKWESMETSQKQHTKELKSLKSKMDDVKFANSQMTKDLNKSEKNVSNLEFEIKQLKKKLENHQKTKPPKECVRLLLSQNR